MQPNSPTSSKALLASLHRFILTIFSLLPSDLSTQSHNLAIATFKKTRLTLHIHFLTRCLKAKIIPVGFRSHFLPSISYIAPSDRDHFSSLDNKISFQRMRATIQCLQKQIRTLDNSIRSHSDLLRTSTSSNRPLYTLIRFIIHHTNSNLYCTLQHHKNNKFSLLHPSPSTVSSPSLSVHPLNVSHASPPASSSPLSSSLSPTTIKRVVCVPPTITLNQDERSILERGLTFVPLVSTVNHYNILSLLEDFFRRMRLHFHFLNSDNRLPSNDPFAQFKPKSTWTPPPGVSAALDLFINSVRRDVTNLDFKPLKQLNLSLPERQAIRSLKNRSDIVIKPADKGGAVVVWDKQLYITEAHRQLHDTNNQFYSPRNNDMTLKNNSIVNKIINEFTNNSQLPSNASYLHIPDSQLGKPCFYLLPKIHKDNSPGRPIVSACSCPTERISIYLDSVFQPIVQNLPSYIQDTTHALNLFREVNFDDGLPRRLFLMDVVSLYTSIPHSLGLQALKFFLDRRTDQSISSPTLLRLAELVLTLNSFEFNGEYFEQISGVAMGTRMGPSYACLFMGHLEHRFFLNYSGPVPDLYLRYIDDGFGVTSLSEQELQNFFSFIQDFSLPIRFTFSQSTSSVNFLDMTVNLTPSGLSTSIFYKKTDSHSYLDYSSSHPDRCKDSIPFSQFLRLRRLCSDENDFRLEAEKMSSFFTLRGFPSTVVDRALRRVLSISRFDALKTRKRAPTSRIPLVLPYHPHTRQVVQLVRKHFSILHQEDHTKEAFPSPPLLAYKRHPNLRDLLVHSRLRHTTTRLGTEACRRSNCKTCHFVDSSATFQFPHRTWHIRNNSTCSSTNIIYAIMCSRCGKKYIGETGLKLSIRFGHHRRDIMNKEHRPVPLHFNQPDHQGLHDVRVAIIQSCTGSADIRKSIENRLIFQLGTLHPDGINISHTFLP